MPRYSIFITGPSIFWTQIGCDTNLDRSKQNVSRLIPMLSDEVTCVKIYDTHKGREVRVWKRIEKNWVISSFE